MIKKLVFILFASVISISSIAGVQKIGNTGLEIDIDPFSQSQRVFVFIYANESFRQYRQSFTPTLIIRCAENVTEMYLNAKTFLSTNALPMRYRIGGRSPEFDMGNTSTDFRMAFFNSPIGKIKQMTKANSMALSIVPYGEVPMILTFDLTGLSESIKPLRKACHW